MALKILIKICEFIVLSKPNTMTLSAFPEKIREIRSIVFNFFLCELLLILRGKNKKKARDIYKRTRDIDFERDRSIGLGSMVGEDQTHTQIFSKTHVGVM